MAHQAKDALNRTARINKLLETWRRRLASRQTKTVISLLDRTARNPFITVNGAAIDLNVAFTTARRAIDTLVSHRVLKQVNESRRDRVYCARALLAILEEPAKLIQAERT